MVLSKVLSHLLCVSLPLLLSLFPSSLKSSHYSPLVSPVAVIPLWVCSPISFLVHFPIYIGTYDGESQKEAPLMAHGHMW